MTTVATPFADRPAKYKRGAIGTVNTLRMSHVRSHRGLRIHLFSISGPTA
jgi:hypothetical protein